MIRLCSSDADFAALFTGLIDARRGTDADVARDVAAILARVRGEGDRAVAEVTRRFDGHDLDTTGWRVEPAACTAALDGLDPALRGALELAHDRITAWHERQRPVDTDITDAVRRAAGRAPHGDRGGWDLCARRARGLPLVRADERRARAGRGRGSAWIAMVTPTPGGAGTTPWCSPPRIWPVWTRSGGSVARRRWARSPGAPTGSRPSTW